MHGYYRCLLQTAIATHACKMFHVALSWLQLTVLAVFLQWRSINLSQAELIKWVLDTRTIAKPPGTDFFYSNFGYMLLARVIEEVTQQVDFV